MAVADTSLAEVAADVPNIGRVSLRTRKTLRGHLAKIYAMHWASDSRYVCMCSMCVCGGRHVRVIVCGGWVCDPQYIDLHKARCKRVCFCWFCTLSKLCMLVLITCVYTCSLEI